MSLGPGEMEGGRWGVRFRSNSSGSSSFGIGWVVHDGFALVDEAGCLWLWNRLGDEGDRKHMRGDLEKVFSPGGWLSLETMLRRQED